MSNRYYSRERLVDCRDCLDTGFVEVLHPTAVEVIMDLWPKGVPDGWYKSEEWAAAVSGRGFCGSVTVMCHCDKAPRKNEQRYDQGLMCAFWSSRPNDSNEWLRGTREREARNVHQKEFA